MRIQQLLGDNYVNYFLFTIEITNCKNRLNIKALRHGILCNLLQNYKSQKIF